MGMSLFNERISALKISLVLILAAVIVEGLIGVISKSLALLGDAAHAFFDLLITIVLLAATTFASKPPDIDHLYGHEKLEPLGSLSGGFALIAFSLLLIYEAFLRISNNIFVNPGFISIGAALFTICIDLSRLKILKKVHESPAVKADLLHALSDFASTIIALVGVLLANFNIYYGDPIASIVLGCMLIYLSTGLIKDSVRDLSDRVAPTFVDAIKAVILASDDVSWLRKLRVRRVGAKTFVDASVGVKGGQTIDQAHSIASKVEENLEQRFKNISTVIHVEPSKRDIKIVDWIRNLCLTVPGVKEAHKITVTNIEVGSLASVHILVDPKINLIEAHKIADNVETILRKEIPSLVEVLVHIEPQAYGVRPGKLINERAVERALTQIIEAHKEIHSVQVLSIVDVRDKLLVSIKCKLDKELNVEKAHRIVEQVKKMVRKTLSSAEIEVHTEPD